MPKQLPVYSPDIKKRNDYRDPCEGIVLHRDDPVSDAAFAAAMDAHKVYFIRAGDNVKIGFTKDIASRLIGLQTGNPYEVRLDAVLLVNTLWNARIIEGALHKRGAELGLSLRNEWFKLTDRDVKNLVKWATVYYSESVLRSKIVVRA